MRLHNLWASIAFANAAAAQFIFPDSSTSLQINQAIQIRWNQAGLQAPLSINLVPAGTAIRQDVVLQQVAVNIGNVGVVQWTADQTITAFPKFAMVIIDARSRVVVSQPFLIQSLTRQPTQQIDLGGGIGGNGGNKQNGDKKDNGNKNGGNSDKNKDKNNGNKNDGKKENNKDGKDGKNGNDGKKEENKDNQQKEKVTEKEEGNKGSNTSLLPLPGLDNAPPASLQPLPTTASVSASTPVAAPEPSPAAPKPTPSAPATSKPTTETSKPSPSPSPSSPAPTEVAKEPAEAQPAPDGFTTLQPAAAAPSSPSEILSTAPPREVEAEAVAPAGSAAADSRLIVAGGSFREQTSEAPIPTTLPSQRGQETITTAITPRPGRFASSASSASLSDTRSPSSMGGTKPTVLSENGARGSSPKWILLVVALGVFVL
ncbi:hypothetical protein PWT90_02849 [Aphanocladium album]|nr:hypothetical protein PWT90_02849 [Aphanocladium album]